MKSVKRLITVLLLALTASFVFAQSLEAKVVAVVGKAEVLQDSTWIQLRPGDSLKQSDIVSTGFKSTLVLKINESQLTVNALTRLTIDELAATSSKDTTKVYVQSGSVEASVNRKESKAVDFSVSTPVATASVRGTSFSMNSLGHLKVNEGSVNYHRTTDKDRQSSDLNEEADTTEESADTTEGSSEETKSTVFTEAQEINSVDDSGIAVYSGWSGTISSTGQASNPVTGLTQGTSLNSSGTESLSSKEAQTMNSTSNSTAADSAASSKSNTAKVIFEIVLED